MKKFTFVCILRFLRFREIIFSRLWSLDEIGDFFLAHLSRQTHTSGKYDAIVRAFAYRSQIARTCCFALTRLNVDRREADPITANKIMRACLRASILLV